MNNQGDKLNWLTALSILLAVLGIISSYYFYTLSIKERVPILMEDPVRSIIVETNSLNKSSLKVVNANGATVAKDISSLRFYLWNNGKEPIKKGNILRPIQVSLDSPDIEIINFRTLRSSRVEVIQPKLELVSANKLNISFEILEYNDGFLVQILFAGAFDAPLKVNGIIEGVGSIQSKVEIRRKIENESKITRIILVILIIMNSLLMLGAFLRKGLKVEDRSFSWQTIKNKGKTFHVLFIIFFMIIMTILLLVIFHFLEESMDQQIKRNVDQMMIDIVPKPIK